MTDHHAAPRAGAAAPDTRVPAAAWDLRVARAVPFALVCTLIAAAGHAVVGGGDVTLPALALGFASVCLPAALLGGRERSLPAIAAALGAGQLGLHLLFHSVGSHAAMAGMHTGAGDGGPLTLPQVAGRLICDDSGRAGLTVVPLDYSPEQLVSAAGLDPQAYSAAPHEALFGLTPSMLLGHLAAAVVAGWWLRRGEAALWRLLQVTATAAQECAAPLRTAFALLTALLLGAAAERQPARCTRGRAEDWRLPVTAALRHSVIRRGPPVAAFAR
ncbi:hypothetical protein ACFC1R_02710 [Kitasatospora sp. NPDC056138]|uniref:hypothetical protein n=1 Tax=Kitasatospora sp. NPDC056138 TaxID=3345724 RepID=UPI0035E32E3D